MPSAPPPPESRVNGAGSEPPTDTIEPFKSLAKGLFGVSRAELADAERKDAEARKTARVAPRGPLVKP
jgi:hypothetical protein